MHKTIQNKNKNDLITLRNLPPELGRIIRQRADEKGLSLNKAVIGFLQETIGPTGHEKEKAIHDDLDALAGSWTKQEAKEFEKTLAAQRAIDVELWKWIEFC